MYNDCFVLNQCEPEMKIFFSKFVVLFLIHLVAIPLIAQQPEEVKEITQGIDSRFDCKLALAVPYVVGSSLRTSLKGECTARFNSVSNWELMLSLWKASDSNGGESMVEYGFFSDPGTGSKMVWDHGSHFIGIPCKNGKYWGRVSIAATIDTGERVMVLLPTNSRKITIRCSSTNTSIEDSQSAHFYSHHTQPYKFGFASTIPSQSMRRILVLKRSSESLSVVKSDVLNGHVLVNFTPTSANSREFRSQIKKAISFKLSQMSKSYDSKSDLTKKFI